MGQQISTPLESPPYNDQRNNNNSNQKQQEGRFPNNFLVMGSYMGIFATSHFKDWHRVDLHLDHQSSSSSNSYYSLMGMMMVMKRVVSYFEDSCVEEEVSSLSEFPGLKNPIIMVASSGNCQLLIDSTYCMTIYRTLNYETLDLGMKPFRVLDQDCCGGVDRRNLLMIGSCQLVFYFVFKDMTIVKYNHEHDTVEIIDFFKKHDREIIGITKSCTGISILILTKMENQYELFEEKCGDLKKAILGELSDKLDSVRLLSSSAIVTNDNKIYVMGLLFPDSLGFKYEETMFENESQIVQVECGFNHCVVLTEDGKAYALGFNHYSQCGMKPGSTNVVRRFTQIEPPLEFQSEILQIGCGSTFTALLTKTHILITGQFSSRCEIPNSERCVKSNDGTLWLVTRNTFGVNAIYCAGWHLCAIEMKETKKECLFGKLLKNSHWLSDLDIIVHVN